MTETFAVPHISQDVRADGSIIVRSAEPVGDHPATVIDSFRAGAAAHPERVLVAQPAGDEWERVTWGDMFARVQGLARGLSAPGVPDGPVMVLSHNSIAHLELALAAMFAGRAVVPASVAYSLQCADYGKLRAMAEVAAPAVIFAEDGAYRDAVRAVAGEALILSGTPAVIAGSVGFDDIRSAAGELPAPPGPEDLAKIMFTSGSTGKPKGVMVTHQMMAVNQQQIRQAWPFLSDEPPVLLDWLPWSHTFGGNHNLNMVLTNGGTLFIDNGRPAPALIGQTVANLAAVSPTIYFNVPAGYAALVPVLERDDAAAARFFAHLRLVFYAAAALPQALWERLERLARRHGSAAMLTTSWGMTETAPSGITAHFRSSSASSIGVPLPGFEVKLAPAEGKTELRVRGPNVTPGFHGRPELAAEVFDEEGFLCTGDAAALVDPEDPGRGLSFEGRIAEDFKLSTGTFVSAGTLRPLLVSACGGRITDAVLCGHDTERVVALVWLHPDHAHRQRDGVPDDDLRAELAGALNELATSAGSSQRVERLLILTEPPALDAGEITDKGYVNQAAVRERRIDSVREVTAETSGVRIIDRALTSGAVGAA